MPQYLKCPEAGKPIFCYFEIDGRCLYAGNCEYREDRKKQKKDVLEKGKTPGESVATKVKIPGQIRTV